MRECTSWWKNKIFSKRMAQYRGKQTGPSMDSVRLPTALQKRFDRFKKSSKTDETSASPGCYAILKQSGETASVGSIDSGLASQTLHKRDGRSRGRIFLSSVPSPQEIRGLEVGDRSITVEPISSASDFHDGHTSTDQKSAETRYVGNVNRLVRRLPPHPDEGVITGIPLLPGGTKEIHVPCAPLRPNVSPCQPMVIYTGSETTQGLGSQKQPSAIPVLRRLAQFTGRQTKANSVDQGARSAVCTTRFTGKWKEIGTATSSTNYIPGRNAGSEGRASVSYSRTKASRPDQSVTHDGGEVYISPIRRVVSRVASSNLSNGSVGKIVPASSSASGNQGSEKGQIERSDGPTIYQDEGTLTVLASRRHLGRRCTLPRSVSPSNHMHRRIPQWVGSGMSRGNARRKVECTSSPHQFPRTQSGKHSSTPIPISVSQQNGITVDRQFNGRSIHQQIGRNEVVPTVGVNSGDRSTGGITQLQVGSTPHCRQIKRTGRPSITKQAGSFIRMEAIPKGFRMGRSTVSVGQTLLGDVRKQYEQTPRQVRLPLPGREGMGDRRAKVCPARTGGNVRISPRQPSARLPPKVSRSVRLSSPTGSTVEPGGEVVPSIAIPQPVVGTGVPNIPTVADTATLGIRIPKSTNGKPTPGVFGKERLIEKGFSESVINRLNLSHATSTQKQYKSMWTLFVGWATDLEPVPRDPTTPSIPLLADFMTHLFEQRNLSSGSINNYRSAIAFFWKRLQGYDLPSDDQVLKDLMSGFKRERPRPKKRLVQWDLKLVLEFFKTGRFASWDTLSNKDLTLKTVFLTALASGKRRSELHALRR